MNKEIQDMLEKMTLEDKIALCSGANFWQTKSFEKYAIPSLFMSDGPHGLRKQNLEGKTDMLGINKSEPATCFPAEVTTAASFHPQLLEAIGQAIGEEAKCQQVGLVLGPGANIKRNPLCGRNFEYFSEDPLLSGKLAAGYIKGLQSTGIGASLKHFAANSQEYQRFTSNSVMDERTLREIYLRAFEIAVKEAKPMTVMCAYSKLNDIHCSDNKYLLNDILRDQWGFQGMVVTDWGAMNDRIKGFKAGCDLNMPGGSAYMEKEVYQAVKEGTLDEDVIDQSVKRVLELVCKQKDVVAKEAHACSQQMIDEHHALAKKAAIEGAVLLKNDHHLLPLTTQKILLVGDMAQNMRYQGSGSSHITPTKCSSLLDLFPEASYAQGCLSDGSTTASLLADVERQAKEVDCAIIVAGLPQSYESEGFDRNHMGMPEGQIKMIKTATQVNSHVVVVLLAGSVVECDWLDDIDALLYMGLPGQAGGEALSDLLYGKASPAGKLAETWPLKYEDCISSSYYDKTKDALYKEGLYVGYRYYDKAHKNVRFPFGYGLSYSQFKYSDMVIEGHQVSCLVKNVGQYESDVVVECYVENKGHAIYRPIQQLAGFQREHLKVNEEKRIFITLDEHAFDIYQDGYQRIAGTYVVKLGESSRDIVLEEEIEVMGKDASCLTDYPSFYRDGKGIPSLRDFEILLGHTYKEPVLKKGNFTMDHTVMEMKDYSWIMKIMYKTIEKTIAKSFDGKIDYDNPDFRMLMASSVGSPLRSMQISGGIKGGLFKGLLHIANGHYVKGIITMLKGSKVNE